MKQLITTLLILLSFTANSQLVYWWPVGIDPMWITQPAASNNTLSWQPSTSQVSSSGFNTGTGFWYQYNHNQISRYTSTQINVFCPNSPVMQVTISLDINLENRYDWLYFQYSTDNGATWINPVANGPTSLNGINLSTYQIPNTTAGNRKGWTGNLGVIAPSYMLPVGTYRFRFIFVTDVSGNTYAGPGGTYIHYADINNVEIYCPTAMPVEVSNWSVRNESWQNLLIWSAESQSCKNYVIERSMDGKVWSMSGNIDCIGLSGYESADKNYQRGAINYYRLSWVDENSETTRHPEIVSIDNRDEQMTVIDVVNTLGQPCSVDAQGLVIIRYSDGSIEKRYN